MGDVTQPEPAVARRRSTAAAAMPAGVGKRCAYMLRNFSVAYKVGIILIVWGARALAVTLTDGDGGAHIESAVRKLQTSSAVTYGLMTCAAVLVFALLYGRLQSSSAQDANAPPVIPSPVPFLGHAIEFNKNPIAFLTKAYKQYGPVFTFEMVGKKFTYLLGSEASALFFNSRNDALNAEEVYGKLVTPVFGPGVAYDVPNDIFLEQKKIFKTGLSIARFREHVHMIEEETVDYLKHWGDSGEINLFEALSELIVLTASRCLHGREIRGVLDRHVAQLYNDLDGGFCAEAWLLPSRLHWLVPRLRRRDAAHREMRSLFLAAIAKRRAAVEKGEYVEDDMLSTLMTSPYKSGRLLTDDEIVGMLIGLLMAGQHTSSSTGSWLGLFLAANPAVQSACYAEQARVRGGGGHPGESAASAAAAAAAAAACPLQPLDYDQLRYMDLLERCLKETLRLQPPLFSIMRKSLVPQKVLGYTIPADHQVCVSPTTNHRLEDAWGKDTESFAPDRFLQESEATNNEKFSYVPFGAGRHRCIGESFAYVQNKVIWSVLLERYELSLGGKQFPQPNYRSMIHTPLHSFVKYRRRHAATLTADAGSGSP